MTLKNLKFSFLTYSCRYLLPKIQNCPNLSKLVQTCPNLSKLVLTWPNLSSNVWVRNFSFLTYSCKFVHPCYYSSMHRKVAKSTGYTFWDWLYNFYTDLHDLFCQYINWTNQVNSGKFMDNYWISCQVMADMKKV